MGAHLDLSEEFGVAKMSKHTSLFDHPSEVMVKSKDPQRCLLIGFEQVLGIYPIRAFYLNAALTYSRMQLPRSYDHLSLPSTSALPLQPRFLSEDD